MLSRTFVSTVVSTGAIVTAVVVVVVVVDDVTGDDDEVEASSVAVVASFVRTVVKIVDVEARELGSVVDR